MNRLSKKQEKEILKKASKNGNSISAKEYNEIVKKSSSQKKFEFTFDLSAVNNDSYCATIKGRHLSTNGILALAFKNKLRYKAAIKESAKLFFALNRKMLPKEPFAKAEMFPTIYLKRSRDDDGDLTLKWIRDLFVSYGFIVDDDREHLVQHKPCEIVGKEYKIELLLKRA